MITSPIPLYRCRLTSPSSLLYTVISIAGANNLHIYNCVQLGPFADMDSPASELLTRRRASQAALVLCLRTWAGITLLVSDHMGLPTLVRMLRDSKVKHLNEVTTFRLTNNLASSNNSRVYCPFALPCER